MPALEQRNLAELLDGRDMIRDAVEQTLQERARVGQIADPLGGAP